MPTATWIFCNSWAADVARAYATTSDSLRDQKVHTSNRKRKRDADSDFNAASLEQNKTHPTTSVRKPTSYIDRMSTLSDLRNKDFEDKIWHSRTLQHLFEQASVDKLLMPRKGDKRIVAPSTHTVSSAVSGAARRKRRNSMPQEGFVSGAYGSVHGQTPPVAPESTRIVFPHIQMDQLPRLPSEHSAGTGTTRTLNSSKKSRSLSPKKSALQFGLDKFTFQNFANAEASTFPQELRRMKDDIEDLSHGSGVLPAEVQVWCFRKV